MFWVPVAWCGCRRAHLDMKLVVPSGEDWALRLQGGPSSGTSSPDPQPSQSPAVVVTPVQVTEPRSESRGSLSCNFYFLLGRADSHCCVCWGVLRVDSVLHAHASVLFWILFPRAYDRVLVEFLVLFRTSLFRMLSICVFRSVYGLFPNSTLSLSLPSPLP